MNIIKCFLLLFLCLLMIDQFPARDVLKTSEELISGSKPEFICSVTNFLTLAIKEYLPKEYVLSIKRHVDLILVTKEKDKDKITQKGQILDIKASNFLPTRQTVIISHGFLGHAGDEWLWKMATAYINYKDVNVIVIDWSSMSRDYSYHRAASSTVKVGKEVSNFIEKIYNAYPEDTNWDSMHLIGHSLGAHICGIVADNLKHSEISKKWKIKRITGLDPAHPCFRGNDLSLSKDDAEFVDIIHTNGNMNAAVAFGLWEDIGHIDFYINGGQLQPGLVFEWPIKTLKAFKEALWSHASAHTYFIESLKYAVNNESLIGISWPTRSLCGAWEFIHSMACTFRCQKVGINADLSVGTGIYFVPTANQMPYHNIEAVDRESITNEIFRIKDFLDTNDQ